MRRAGPRRCAAAGLALVLAGLGAAGTADACRCAIGGERTMTQRAALAVIGRTIADGVYDLGGTHGRESLPPPRRVTVFAVERVVKGRAGAERIAVLHGTRPAACGLVFEPQARYLLTFGKRRRAALSPLRANLCTVRRLSGE